MDYGGHRRSGILCPEPNREGRPFRQWVDLLVNTSCEHLHDFTKWYSMIPAKTPLLLQSNDHFASDEHVNCISTLEEFKKLAPMQEVLYEGVLDCKLFRRYMLIGYK